MFWNKERKVWKDAGRVGVMELVDHPFSVIPTDALKKITYWKVKDISRGCPLVTDELWRVSARRVS